MNTPHDGQQDPYRGDPAAPEGNPPPQSQQSQGTRAPGEDVPRQEPPSWEYGQQASAGSYGPYPQGADSGYQDTGYQDTGYQGSGYQDTGNRGTGYWGSGYQGSGYPGGGYPPGAARPPDSYLGGARVGFGQAVSLGLRNVLTFQGRASRSAFWWFFLFTVILQAAIELIVGGSARNSQAADSALSAIMALLTLAVSIRRLHDSGRSGWWWLIGLIPLVGWIILLFFYLRPSTPGPNQYDVAGPGTGYYR
jgi:uncharacterized membrane protein YhaH (DUF805 family)